MALTQISGKQIKDNAIVREHLSEGLLRELGGANHAHIKHTLAIEGSEKSQIEFSTLGVSEITATTFKATDDIEVFVNGILQIEDSGYTVTKDSGSEYMTGIEFSEAIAVGEVVTLKWTKY